jgi:hypothetical protein
MPITFTKAYVANGKTFATLDEARLHALAELLAENPRSDVAAMVLEQAESTIDILTTTPNSKPSARKINGGRKPRKPRKPKEAPEAPALALT